MGLSEKSKSDAGLDDEKVAFAGGGVLHWQQ